SQLALLAALDLHFGFDIDFSGLADGEAPAFTLDGDTHLDATVSTGAGAINGIVGVELPIVGTVGLLIDGGAASLDFGVHANLGGSGRVKPGEVGSAFHFDVAGNALLDLPLYFPIKSMPLGGSDQDGDDADSIADNVLHAQASFTLANLHPSVSYALPQLDADFDAAAALMALLNNPQTILNGLEGFFSGIDDIADGIDAMELPLIGGSAFDGLAGSLRA